MARGKHGNLASGQPQQLSHSLSHAAFKLNCAYHLLPSGNGRLGKSPKKATLSKCKAQVQTAVIVYEQWE